MKASSKCWILMRQALFQVEVKKATPQTNQRGRGRGGYGGFGGGRGGGQYCVLTIHRMILCLCPAYL